MKANYPYPKDEIEFYARPYSINQLVEHYNFQDLVAYYIFGMNTLKHINLIIENKLFDSIGRTPFMVEQDKVYFIVRTEVVKKAMEKMDSCKIISAKNMLFVEYNN